jgi:hypothetical protein
VYVVNFEIRMLIKFCMYFLIVILLDNFDSQFYCPLFTVVSESIKSKIYKPIIVSVVFTHVNGRN